MTENLLILASNSPRRKELLALLQVPFEVIPGNVDETARKNERAEGYVQRLAIEKAHSVPLSSDQVVIAADTVVIDQGEILGKPVDKADAKRMLQTLRGHTHRVMTAITLVSGRSGQVWMDACETDVPMREYVDLEIEGYIESGDPMDKAGAYAIQHPGFHPVERLCGCYASVMGLPLCHVTRGLRKLGVVVPVDVARECQNALGYDCPVYQDILPA
jgi:septum formation protein